LFGDPRAYSAADTPVLSLNVTIEVENPVEEVVWDSAQDVTCDFVDGFAFGDAFGIGLRSVDGWWTVKNVTFASDKSDVRGVFLNHAYDPLSNLLRAPHFIFYVNPALRPPKHAQYLCVSSSPNPSLKKNCS
jgi:hypothetical protein